MCELIVCWGLIVDGSNVETMGGKGIYRGGGGERWGEGVKKHVRYKGNWFVDERKEAPA